MDGNDAGPRQTSGGKRVTAAPVESHPEMTALLIRGVRPVPIAHQQHVGRADILVVDGVIREIGESLSRPAGADELDADGRWAVPGLWDQHTHLAQWTAAAERLDLSSTRTAWEALDAVAVRLNAAPGRPVIGAGMRAAMWPEPGHVAELDAISGPVPVVLINGDCHHGWCNSAALEALGLPPRDDVLAETEWFDVFPRLDLISENETSPASYRRMLQRAASRGVVGMVDFEFGARWQDWVDRWDRGGDLLRIVTSVYPNRLPDVIAAGLRTGDRLAGNEEGADLRLGRLKIISDGSLGTRTAWCCAPYAGDPQHYGAPNQTREDLESLLSQAHSAGLEVATHAIGDRALIQALDGYAATGARGSIEHVQLATGDTIERLAALGLVASVQPAHLYDDRDLSEQVWPDRTESCFALRSMLDAGVDVVLGSDAPVAALDPWLAIQAAVHRSADDRSPWHPQQALTVAEAIACSTNGNVLQPGAPGDVVLLDRDPLSVDPRQLRDVPVAVTTVGGRVVHDGR